MKKQISKKVFLALTGLILAGCSALTVTEKRGDYEFSAQHTTFFWKTDGINASHAKNGTMKIQTGAIGTDTAALLDAAALLMQAGMLPAGE